MKKIKKTSIFFLLIILLLVLVGCDSKQEVVEEKKVVVDEKIKNVEYYINALENLNFPTIDINKEYTLEDLTVYLMELFNKTDEAIENNYQCPYEEIKENNKPIIAYAYANWYLTGIESKDLTESNENTCNNLIALLLRIMGYKDYGDNRDFTLGNKVLETSENALEEGEVLIVNNAIMFIRSLNIDFDTKTGHVRGDYLAKLMWDILDKECKDEELVKEKLIDEGIFKESNYDDSTYLVKGEEIPEKVYYVPKVVEYTPPIEEAPFVEETYSGGGGGSYTPTPPVTPEPPVDPPAPPSTPDLPQATGGNETAIVGF